MFRIECKNNICFKNLTLKRDITNFCYPVEYFNIRKAENRYPGCVSHAHGILILKRRMIKEDINSYDLTNDTICVLKHSLTSPFIA